MKGLLSKKSVKAAVIFLAAAACIAAVTVGLVKADVFADPKKAVEEAVYSLTGLKEESASENVFGWKKLSENMEKEGAEYTFDFSVSDIPGSLAGLNGLTIPKAGFAVRSRVDFENETQDGALDLKVADTKLASLKYYADNKGLQLAVPQFFEAVLSLPYGAEDFKEQLKQSYLLELAGISAEDIDGIFTFGNENAQYRQLKEGMEKLEKKHASSGKTLLSKMQVKKNGKTVLATENGELKCKNYSAVLPEEAVEAYLTEVFALLPEYLELLFPEENFELALQSIPMITGDENFPSTKAEFAESLNAILDSIKAEISDVTLITDLKGTRVIRLALTADGETEHIFTLTAEFAESGCYFDDMKFALFVRGAEKPFAELRHKAVDDKEEFTSNWEIVSAEGDMLLELRSVYDKVTGEFEVSVAQEETEIFVLTGDVTELKKGEAVAAELSKVRCLMDGVEYEPEFALNISVQVMENAPEKLSETPQNVLAMTGADWNALVEEMGQKLAGMIFGLGGLFR